MASKVTLSGANLACNENGPIPADRRSTGLVEEIGDRFGLSDESDGRTRNA
ncbi:MAG: hypothetical protein ABJC13_03955 [Acidobacteriota bacterium]